MPGPARSGFTAAELRMWELGRDFGARLVNLSTLDAYEAGLVEGYELAGRLFDQMLHYVTQSAWADRAFFPPVEEHHRDLFITAVRDLTQVGRPWPCKHNGGFHGYTDRASPGGEPSEDLAAGVARGDRGGGREDRLFD